MKNNHLFLAFLAIFFGACSESSVNQEENVQAATLQVSYTEVEGEVGKYVALLDISGMSCEKMCVSSVNKKLISTEGVKSVEINFETERELNQAYVEFDESVTTAEQLIEAVHSIANGAYQIKNVTVEKHLAPTDLIETTSDTLEYEASLKPRKEDLNTSSYIIPNLFEFFFSIVR
jgi:copper chaperone CopZ